MKSMDLLFKQVSTHFCIHSTQWIIQQVNISILIHCSKTHRVTGMQQNTRKQLLHILSYQQIYASLHIKTLFPFHILYTLQNVITSCSPLNIFMHIPKYTYIIYLLFVFVLLNIIDLLYLVLLNLYKKTLDNGKIDLSRFKSYLARLTLAFCPPLRVAPRSPITVRSPSGSSSMSFIQHRKNYSISTLQLSIQQILNSTNVFNINNKTCFGQQIGI